MNVPGLGEVTRDDRFGWYYSEPIPIPILGGEPRRIILEGYDDDLGKADFHVAIANFLSATPSVLKESEPYIYQYYKDCAEYWEDDDLTPIETSSDVWAHVHLGNEPMVSRRPNGDKGIYISIEGECDWEPEHGLQIVFKNGLKVNKIGPFDGHLTNSDAFAKDYLENVIYRERG